MALKPIACLSFFEQVSKIDHFLPMKNKRFGEAAGGPNGPGSPGYSVAIGSGSYHPSTRAGRRIA